MKNINGPLKVGIGGPVGAGKTSLTAELCKFCLLYTSPSPRDGRISRMPSSA